MANKMDARMKLKRSSVAGVVPTVPTSNDHCDGTWLATDIYKSELFFNEADNILYTRDETGIVVITGDIGLRKPYETTGDIPTGATGLVITIPSGTYLGEVQGVDVWHNNIQIYPTVEKGTSGANQTVTLRSGKAYTGAEINIRLK